MMKLIVIMLGGLLLYGCGSESSESETCRYYIQQDLDNENYDSALIRLQDSTCQSTYSQEDYLVDEGTAYFGRSGFTLPKVMAALIVEDTEKETESFQIFMETLSTHTNNFTEFDLQNSYNSFKQFLNNQSCFETSELNAIEKNVCLEIGFIQFIRVMIAIKYLSGGDIEGWLTQNNEKLIPSNCALKYSVVRSADPTLTLPYENCYENAMVEFSDPIQFKRGDQDSQNYNLLSVLYENKTSYFLEDEAKGSIVVTQDYCQTDYSVCSASSDADCYPCPFIIDTESASLDEYLPESLNGAINTIRAIAKNTSPDERSKMEESLSKFKEEIKPEGCSEIAVDESCLSLDDILDYMNAK